MKDEPNKITATLKVVITGEFYGEVSEETLRYFAEQDLEDDGFDVDVTLLKEQEPKAIVNKWHKNQLGDYLRLHCPWCDKELDRPDAKEYVACPYCGKAVKWDE